MVLIFVLAVAAITLGLFRLAYCADATAGQPSFFSPAIFTTTLLALGYVWRPLLYIVNPLRATVFPDYHLYYSPEIVAILIVAGAAGIAAFTFGFRAGAGAAIARALPDLEWRNPWYCTLLLLGLGIIAVAEMRNLLANARIENILVVNIVLRQTVMRNFAGNGPILFIILSLENYFLLATMLYLTKRREGLRGVQFILVLAIVLFFLAMACYVVLFSRALLISLLLLAPFLIHYYVRRIPTVWQWAFMVGLLVLGGFVGLLMTGLFVKTGVATEGIVLSMIWRVAGTLDQFESLYLAVSRTEHFYFGLTYLQDMVITFMPRAIWTTKPEIYGTMLLQNDLMPNLYSIAGLSASYPVGFFAEGYMNFGPAGFIIPPFLYGMMLRVLTERSLSPASGYSIMLLGTMATNVAILRGLGAILGSTIFGFSILLIFFRPRFQSPTARRPPGLAASAHAGE